MESSLVLFLCGMTVGVLAYAFAQARSAEKYRAQAPQPPPQPPPTPTISVPDGTPDAVARAAANAPALFEQARRAEAVRRQWAATRCGLTQGDRGPCLLDRGHAAHDCIDQKGPFEVTRV